MLGLVSENENVSGEWWRESRIEEVGPKRGIAEYANVRYRSNWASGIYKNNMDWGTSKVK